MDLPPTKKAIVFEDMLLGSDQILLPIIPLAMRGKHSAFTKNVTAAQSIEVGSERFGIFEVWLIGVGNRLRKRRILQFDSRFGLRSFVITH